MRAVRIHAFGGPEVLTLEEAPTPEPAASEMLVRIEAASVNPVDYKIRNGGYLGADQLPLTLGRDVAGVVERIGAEVAGFVVGDAVYAMLPHDRGGYADYVAIPAGVCAKRPPRLSAAEAAAVPLAALTAWQGLFDQGGLSEGQSVLIHGAAGGVGHFAVQFARAKGAAVTATCGAGDRDFVRGLGAHAVIDYKAERFEDLVKDVDVVFDLIGGETRERSWGVLKPGGVLVSTLGPPSAEAARLHNVRAVGYMAGPNGAELAQIARMIEAGEVSVTLDRTYPLSAAAAAESRLEHEHVRGKIVLQVGEA